MKTKTQLCSLLLAGSFLVTAFPTVVTAQTSETPTMPAQKGSSLKYGDRNFLTKAAAAGDEEIAISKVAVDRSTNPQVKEYAQMVIDDHQKIGVQLAAVVSAKSLELSAKPVSTKKWDKKDAKDFDKDYISKMVDDHEDAVSLFTKGARSDDSQIATFATQQLPMLQTHLSRAKELKKTLE